MSRSCPYMVIASCLLAFLVAPSVASADPLEYIAGTTDGTFANNQSSFQNLSFTGVAFDNSTSNTVPLGTFSLGSCLLCIRPYELNLNVTFTNPGNVSPNSLSSTADVLGIVVFNVGGAYINFSNSLIDLSYGTGGSFDLRLSDVAVSVGKTATLYGTFSNIKVAASDSDSGVVLLMTLGVSLLFFRKRLV